MSTVCKKVKQKQKQNRKLNGTQSLKCIYWNQAYIYSLSVQHQTVLTSFRYKILHRILPTNKYLFICKLKNSNLCDFWSSFIETIEHIFWECPITQRLWSQLVNFLNNRGIMITINIMYVWIGTDQCRNHNSTINFVLLLMKYVIYTTTLNEMIPVFCVFRNYLHKRINLEKRIALTNNKLEKFYNMSSFVL